jgi:hypothetical protein
MAYLSMGAYGVQNGINDVIVVAANQGETVGSDTATSKKSPVLQYPIYANNHTPVS